VTPTILAIETAGRSPRARRIRFDGSEQRTTSASVVKTLGLAEGDTWDLERLDVAIAQVEPDLARDRALRMLTYRERSRSELRKSLVADGYSLAAAETVVERFTEISLLDDDRFARAWAISRVRAGYDRRRICRELADKGVDPHLVEQVIDEVAPREHDLDRARAALRGKRATSRTDRDRLVRRLVSRGFDLQTAIAAASGDETETSSDLPLP
jgi:regulatory protein